MQSLRMRRINEAVKEVVGQVIVGELEDPRIGFVTVTRVKVSPDIRIAKIYVSVMGDEAEVERTLEGLSHSHGLIQGRIADQLKLRNTPSLKFVYDEHIDSLLRIDELVRETQRKQEGRSSDN